MPIITLTTDFGYRDGYVGAMKGVIARIAPEATLVDLAHDIPRGDVAHAAWVVATSTLEFPHETIHVVVVDPGVGGARPGVIVRVDPSPPRGQQTYVGPDNGVFAYLPAGKVFAIENTAALAPTISPTFHGRDVFAYVAGGLAFGRSPSHFGKRSALEGSPLWGPRLRDSGRVVHVDHFGNLVTDLVLTSGAVQIKDRVLPLVATYESVAHGQLLAYVGSANTVEIAVRDGRADEELGVERGERVMPIVEPSAPSGPYR